MQIFVVSEKIPHFSSNGCVHDRHPLRAIQSAGKECRVHPDTFLCCISCWFLFRMALELFLPPREEVFALEAFWEPSRYAHRHQPSSNTGCCFGEAPQSSRIAMLYRCLVPTGGTRGVAVGTTRRSSTATTTCNASLHLFLQEFGLSATGSEGKCTPSVMYVCMGINWCVRTGRKRTSSIFQESCQPR